MGIVTAALPLLCVLLGLVRLWVWKCFVDNKVLGVTFLSLETYEWGGWRADCVIFGFLLLMTFHKSVVLWEYLRAQSEQVPPQFKTFPGVPSGYETKAKVLTKAHGSLKPPLSPLPPPTSVCSVPSAWPLCFLPQASHLLLGLCTCGSLCLDFTSSLLCHCLF